MLRYFAGRGFFALGGVCNPARNVSDSSTGYFAGRGLQPSP